MCFLHCGREIKAPWTLFPLSERLSSRDEWHNSDESNIPCRNGFFFLSLRDPRCIVPISLCPHCVERFLLLSHLIRRSPLKNGTNYCTGTGLFAYFYQKGKIRGTCYFRRPIRVTHCVINHIWRVLL